MFALSLTRKMYEKEKTFKISNIFQTFLINSSYRFALNVVGEHFSYRVKPVLSGM